MEHVTEVHTLSIRTDDVDCERTYGIRKTFLKSPLQGKRLFLLIIISRELAS